MAVSLERRTGVVALLYWFWDGVDRTIFTAIKFSFPARFVSPFGFLGMLTFIVFIILGVSGADRKSTRMKHSHKIISYAV